MKVFFKSNSKVRLFLDKWSVKSIYCEEMLLIGFDVRILDRVGIIVKIRSIL